MHLELSTECGAAAFIESGAYETIYVKTAAQIQEMRLFEQRPLIDHLRYVINCFTGNSFKEVVFPKHNSTDVSITNTYCFNLVVL